MENDAVCIHSYRSEVQYFSVFSILSVFLGLMHLYKETVKEACLPIECFVWTVIQIIEIDDV